MGCYLQHTSLLLEQNGLELVCWHTMRWRCQFNTTQVCRITFCSFFTLADSFFAHHFNRMSGPYLTNCTFKIFVLDRMQFFSCLSVEKGNATPKYVSVCFAFFWIRFSTTPVREHLEHKKSLLFKIKWEIDTRCGSQWQFSSCTKIILKKNQTKTC